MPASRTRLLVDTAALPARDAAAQARRRWLLFVHQLPSTPSNLRVKTWRRMQQLGAIAIKQAVYVLPDSAGAREDFEWLKTEVEGAGGDVNVFSADSVDAWSDDALVEAFRRSRQDAYEEIARDLEQALRKAPKTRARATADSRASRRMLEGYRQRMTAVQRVDFFGSAGRDRVFTLIDELDARLSGGSLPAETPTREGRSTDGYRGRLWVTRPRPGVDRMSSAWLIRRFIDLEARFSFVPDRDAAPKDALPFDMFGVEFTHQGERCTFETLSHTFGIADAAVIRLAGIVHDLDLKDGRFGAPEAPAIGTVIDGLQMLHAADAELLTQGITLFEALYRAFDRSTRRPRPTPVAARKKAPRGRRERG